MSGHLFLFSLTFLRYSLLYSRITCVFASRRDRGTTPGGRKFAFPFLAFKLVRVTRRCLEAGERRRREDSGEASDGPEEDDSLDEQTRAGIDDVGPSTTSSVEGHGVTGVKPVRYYRQGTRLLERYKVA